MIVIQSDQAKAAEQKQLDVWKDEIESLLLEVAGDDKHPPFVIENEEDFTFAAELLKHVKGQTKDIEARKQTVTKPLNQALKNFRELFEPTLKPLAKLERLLKDKIGTWELKREEERRKKIRELAEAASKGDFDAAHEASLAIPDNIKVAGVSVTYKWVLDETQVDLSKVPLRYLTLDLDEVNRHIKAAAGEKPADVEGLVFKKISSVRSGST